MLQITIPKTEMWDEINGRFIYVKEQTLQLEHSLVSISKWESKWHKPFLSKEEKTNEETIDYIRCMTLTRNVNPEVYNYLTRENFMQINAYIEDPMTATTFSKDNSSKRSREIVTSELIYYWMLTLTIPPEYEKWHLNRLLTLIRVCNVKNTPPKRRGKRELASERAALNASRRARYNTKG